MTVESSWERGEFSIGAMRRRESVSFSFVNTTDPIWTYKTTNDGEVICEVDEMESITQVDFLFRKLFLMRRRRFEVPLRGQFYHFQPDRMTITSRDMTPMCTEILLYMARDRSCAVFKIKSLIQRGDVRFDLRVRNSSIHAKPHGGCNNFFYHHVKKRPVFPLYKPTCQRVLRPPK
uniref:Putative lipocalin lipocalin n=1 Tax=Rhipicephalus microplus TaxID=6941 RepID=A0A6G5A5Y3_RHIMP